MGSESKSSSEGFCCFPLHEQIEFVAVVCEMNEHKLSQEILATLQRRQTERERRVKQTLLNLSLSRVLVRKAKSSAETLAKIAHTLEPSLHSEGLELTQIQLNAFSHKCLTAIPLSNFLVNLTIRRIDQRLQEYLLLGY